jgi:hypothetical protein
MGISATLAQFNVFAADNRRGQIYYAVAGVDVLVVYIDGTAVRWVLFPQTEADFVAVYPAAIRVEQIFG